MGIQGHASLMSAEGDSSHPSTDHINAILEYTENAADLARQLLGFARGGQYEVKPTEINEVVAGSATMFGRTKKEIRIHTRLHTPPPVAIADRRQIEQVLLNMYINAWQAMPGGGDLFLETSVVVLEENAFKEFHSKPGRYVKISITDTGIGMDKEIHRRIFDPFFTTKHKSRGTGLGLASAYGIIKNHGGAITVYSEVGKGTTFHIYLPESAQAVRGESALNAELVRGSATILLVDDERMILEVTRSMLEKLGYHVIVAAGGEQAVEIIDQRADEIDLVILDMIMPGMDGGKTFDRIRAIRPAMPVLLSSGYAMNTQADEIMRKGCNGFIQKPFQLEQLSRTVRAILETGSV